MSIQAHLESLVSAALDEDIGQRDITTEATVPEDARCKARLLAKQDGVVSGIEPYRLAFELLDAGVEQWESLKNGDPFKTGGEIATFQAHTRAVLTAERTAMNFIQHLSGVATLTAQFVAALEGLGC